MINVYRPEKNGEDKPPVSTNPLPVTRSFFGNLGNFFRKKPSQTAQLPPQSTTNNELYNGPVVYPNEVKIELPANSSNPSPIQKSAEITENFIKITPDVFVKQVFEQVKTIISSSNFNSKTEIINIIDECITYINKNTITFTESSSNLESSKLYYQLLSAFCSNVAYIFRDILDKKPDSDKLYLFQNQYNALSETYNKIIGNSDEVIRKLEDEIKRSNCQNKNLNEIQGVIAKNFNEIIAKKNEELVQLQARCPGAYCDESDDESDSDCKVCDEKPLQATQIAVASQITSKAKEEAEAEEAKKKRENSGLNGEINNPSNSSKIVKLNITISDQTVNIEGKTDEIKVKEAEIADLKKQLTGNSSKRSELEIQLKEKKGELNKLTGELSALKEAQEKSKAALKQAMTNANAARQEAQTARREAQTTKTNANTALKNTQTKYNSQITLNLAKISELEKQLSKSSANAQENQKIKQKIEQLQQEVKNTAQTAKTKLEQSQVARQEAQAAKNATLAEKNTAQAARQQAETELSIRNAEIAELKANAATKNAKIKELEENSEAAKAKKLKNAENAKAAKAENLTKLNDKKPLYNGLITTYNKLYNKLKLKQDSKLSQNGGNSAFIGRFNKIKDICPLLFVIPPKPEDKLLKDFSELQNSDILTVITQIDILNQELINLSEDVNGSVRVIVRIKPSILKEDTGIKVMKFNETTETDCKESSIIPILPVQKGGACKNNISIDSDYPQDDLAIVLFKSFKVRVSPSQINANIYTDYYNIFSDPPFSNFGAYSGIPFIKDNFTLNPSTQSLSEYINTKKDSESIKKYYQESNLRKSFEQVKYGYSIVLFGYGYSGSGKTFTLLGSGNTKGVLQYGIEDMKYDKVELAYVFEEYSVVDITVSTQNAKISKLSGKIYQLYGNNLDINQTETIIQNFTTDFTTDFTADFTAKFTNMSDEIAKLREYKDNLRIKATINNPTSSRSHLYIIFKVTHNNTTGYITIIDMAGRENPLRILENILPKKEITTPPKTEPIYSIGSVFSTSSDPFKQMQECIDNKYGKTNKTNKTNKTSTICFYDDANRQKVTDYINILNNTKINITDKNAYIKSIIKEGFYINESINHLKYYLKNKSGTKDNITMMNNNTINDKIYKTDSYYINPTKISTINILKDSNCLTIPILKFLDYGIRGITTQEEKDKDDKPTKFIMICAIRQEPDYANDVIDTLAFADSIKST